MNEGAVFLKNPGLAYLFSALCGETNHEKEQSIQVIPCTRKGTE
jgi:hypothetical protein